MLATWSCDSLLVVVVVACLSSSPVYISDLLCFTIKLLVVFSKGLADNTVIAKVNGSLWDLDRPLEADCSIKLLKFDDEEAQKVFWHSTAHILGESLERVSSLVFFI